jgi:hypothetical protein
VSASADQVQLSARSTNAAAQSQAIQAQQAGRAATAAAAANSGPLVGPALYEGLKTGFVDGYMNPKEILERCQQLADKYPNLVEIVESEQQTSGYDGKNAEVRGPGKQYYLRVGPKTEDRDKKLGVFQFAAPHAREWVNPLIMLELTEQLAANYDPSSTNPAVQANTQLLDKLDVFIAPMTNPDGTNYSMFDEKMWRKNRAPYGESVGVDVNRNYPTGWVAGDPSEITFGGSGPLSEKETQHIVGVLDRHPNIRFICDWHSYAEEIRKPWGVSDQDMPLYNAMHTRMTDAIASVRDTKYGNVFSEVIEGTSDDYFYHERKTYSMLVETAKAFQPKESEALKVTEECTRGARELLRFAAEHQEQQGLAAANPPASIPRIPG